MSVSSQRLACLRRVRVLFYCGVLIFSVGCGTSAQESSVGDDDDTVAVDTPPSSDSGTVMDGVVDTQGAVEDGQTSLDASPDSGDLDIAADASSPTCPGGPGCACVAADDCSAGLCLDGACAAVCEVGGCNAGQVCVDVGETKVCVSAWGRLCWPCETTADCAAPGVTGAACVDQTSTHSARNSTLASKSRQMMARRTSASGFRQTPTTNTGHVNAATQPSRLRPPPRVSRQASTRRATSSVCAKAFGPVLMTG
jgi:hypothetical protein